MAYSRRVPKVDIRNLSISQTAEPISRSAEKKEPETQLARTIAWHNPVSELKMIAWCGLPLIILLITASYFDIKKGWVIPLAEWLMHR